MVAKLEGEAMIPTGKPRIPSKADEYPDEAGYPDGTGTLDEPVSSIQPPPAEITGSDAAAEIDEELVEFDAEDARDE
jgi:hypothetical protein